MSKLYIITGPAGVGKSTISKKIASSLSKSVLIEGDDIYNQFVGGRISPWKEDAPLDLFWENSVMLINNYLENGYDVVFNYIIKKGKFSELKKIFKDYEISFTVLLTDEKTIVERDSLRPVDCRMGERSLILLNEFKEAEFDDNYILDTSNMSIEDTVKEVVANNRFVVKRMSIDDVKTPEDVLQFMVDHISYGWKDTSNNKHINEMQNFRQLYRTSSLEETLTNGIGTCVEQSLLMKHLLEKLGIKTKIFCSRFYEDETVTDINKEVHMHCALLYYFNDKVYHMEHANGEMKGIYEYDSEEDAIGSIKEYYEEKDGAPLRTITEISSVSPNLSFRDLNLYVNSIDNENKNKCMKKQL
ncbi:MAG: AAA family ATPase [Bacilli bacterium]|nr:AAA family ATPase [Bacilli bacterium]